MALFIRSSSAWDTNMSGLSRWDLCLFKTEKRLEEREGITIQREANQGHEVSAGPGQLEN
jgi:hypothetical protein